MKRIKILEYNSTVMNRNQSIVIATVKYLFDGVYFERTFLRDLSKGLSTRDYLTPYHL